MHTVITRCLLVVVVLVQCACVSSPPKNLANVCDIFDEKSHWYKQAKKSSKRWGIPIAVNMAFMHQESRFVSRAKPPRKKILGFIPGPRKSSSFGYSQAKKATWAWYKKKSGHRGADRDDFDDSIDFIAWYNNVSVNTLNLKLNDAYHLYLAYHEGHGGFKKRSYAKKAWLKKVALKVSARAKSYQKQLNACEKRLSSRSWFF